MEGILGNVKVRYLIILELSDFITVFLGKNIRFQISVCNLKIRRENRTTDYLSLEENVNKVSDDHFHNFSSI